jgi:predicted NAD/FAD-binding protein
VRTAIIGGGISGLYTAHRLAPECEIVVFEAGSHAGGHSNTVEVAMDGQRLAIDTGFIVFNEKNYPHFTALLRELGVAWQPADMSFSFRCAFTGLEYRGDNTFDAIFAQRRNVFRPSFHRMILDILRFNRLADRLVAAPADQTLGEFLAEWGLRGPMVENYLLPMAGAIWSSEPDQILAFPACHFGRFFANHGLLQVNDRPQWMTVTGGSREYVKALIRPFRDRIHVNCPIEWVQRHPGHVLVKPRNRPVQQFDYVVFACHSDQALALLRDPSREEREILGAIPFQDNDCVLHTDERLLPRRRRAWAAWNYHRDPGTARNKVSVTYNLTRLQSLPTRRQFQVTLNNGDAMDPRTVLYRINYLHPVYNMDTIRAQARHGEINGRHRSFYCGAYWGYGFHEDGVRSAIAVCDAFQKIAGPAAQADTGAALLTTTGADRPTGTEDEKLYLSGTG